MNLATNPMRHATLTSCPVDGLTKKLLTSKTLTNSSWETFANPSTPQTSTNLDSKATLVLADSKHLIGMRLTKPSSLVLLAWIRGRLAIKP